MFYVKDLILLYRVALARAVYARTKYVLLDDPLSAVVSRLGSPYLSSLILPQDSHTSRYLYEHLLCGPLLANRTVVGTLFTIFLEPC